VIEFPPEFYGLVDALWSTYQPTIWVWMALMFSAFLILGVGVIAYNVIRRVTG
jgi:hypothetical protein